VWVSRVRGHAQVEQSLGHCQVTYLDCRDQSQLARWLAYRLIHHRERLSNSFDITPRSSVYQRKGRERGASAVCDLLATFEIATPAFRVVELAERALAASNLTGHGAQ
jgi:hypothetical protein